MTVPSSQNAPAQTAGASAGPGDRAARPAVVGHRGAALVSPENTLASFRRALDDGAQLLECDVHLSAATGDQGGREGHPGQRGQEPPAPARTQGTAWSGNRCGICTGGRVRCRGGGHDVSFSVLALGWAERSAPVHGASR